MKHSKSAAQRRVSTQGTCLVPGTWYMRCVATRSLVVKARVVWMGGGVPPGDSSSHLDLGRFNDKASRRDATQVQSTKN